MTDFRPLPELPAPPEAEACMRCELNRQRSRVIWAEGYADAPLLVLLDNPGEREDREGNPFVCGTRQTLQAAAQEAGIPLTELYITWLLKCRPKRAYNKEEARAACGPFLEAQLAAQAPRLVLALGNVAVQSYLGDPEAEVKALRGRVLQRGGRPLICSYHPLAVRRRPNLWPLLVEDLGLVRVSLNLPETN